MEDSSIENWSLLISTLDEEVSEKNEYEEEEVSLSCDEDFINKTEINQNSSDCFCLTNVTH